MSMESGVRERVSGMNMNVNVNARIRDRVSCKAYLVVKSEDEQIMESHWADRKYQIASLTKIMTFYVCLQILE